MKLKAPLRSRCTLIKNVPTSSFAYQFTKAALDATLAVSILFFLLPLLCIIALLIKLTSPGPVIYSQTRIGQYGKKFKIFKFRTMVINADEVLNAYLAQNEEMRREWLLTRKLKNDPRITKVGRILRKYSLDELPQLWNVLRGEMSLVGPRPITREELVKYYQRGAIYYLMAKPGMTGLWQVSGRNDTSYEERVKLDVYYVKHWNLFLDAKILLKTIKVVLFGKGAY